MTREGHGDVRLSVNMSSQQLEQDGFLDRFGQSGGVGAGG
jgi:hypothetical protein